MSPTWLCAHSGKPPPSIKGLPDHEAPPPKPREKGSIPAGGRGLSCEAPPAPWGCPGVTHAGVLPECTSRAEGKDTPRRLFQDGWGEGTGERRVGSAKAGHSATRSRRSGPEKRAQEKAPRFSCVPRGGEKPGGARPASRRYPCPPAYSGRRAGDPRIRESLRSGTQYLCLILPQVAGFTG